METRSPMIWRGGAAYDLGASEGSAILRRRVRSKNVLEYSDDEIRRVDEQCKRSGIAVRAIGSPIGKSSFVHPVAREMRNPGEPSKSPQCFACSRFAFFRCERHGTRREGPACVDCRAELRRECVRLSCDLKTWPHRSKRKPIQPFPYN
jgi:hypothetical protein